MDTTHQQCLLCNSPRIVEMKRYSKEYLMKCNDCGFIFCSKIPTVEELTKHYQCYPRSEAISPITIKRYHELLDSFEIHRKNNTILDIGCGNGHFLAVAKQRGWDVFGTEYTDEAITICKSKSISMQKGVLDPINYESIKFDVITSFEVIEHINNPQSDIKNTISLLRNGGIFYFTTPNFNSLSRLMLKEKWNVIEYPEHLSYYTAGTMNRFLLKNGLKKIKIETTGISINRIQQSTTFLNSATNPNKDESIREKTESNSILQGVKKSINFILNVFKIGDALKGTYQKP